MLLTVHSQRSKKTIALVTCLVYAWLLQPPRLHAAEPLTTIALAASAAGVLMQLFDSGSDLTRAIVEQNRELLLDNRKLLSDLHDRFGHFGRALEGMLKKIDDLPAIMRKEIITALDDFQQDKVLALVQLVVEDRAILRAGGSLGTDPRDRLRVLQQESRTLFRRSDFNAPVLMTAMAYELALLAALKASPEEIATRENAYRQRLQLVVDRGREGSLISHYDSLAERNGGDRKLCAEGIFQVKDFLSQEELVRAGTRMDGKGGFGSDLSLCYVS